MDHPVAQPNHSPIFIVGNVHSGTTLVQRILENHPSILTGLGESAFFRYLVSIRMKYPDLEQGSQRKEYVTFLAKIFLDSYGRVEHFPDKGAGVDLASFGVSQQVLEELLADSQQYQDHVALYIYVADRLTATLGKERWLEKTPQHIFYLNQIIDAVPTCRIVEIVRDPRAVLASKQTRRTEEWIRHEIKKRPMARYEGGYDPLLDTLGWKSAIQAGKNAQRQFVPQFRRIRYEDLVADPAAVVQSLCEFLELEFSPELLQVTWTNATSVKNEGSRGIGADAVEKWRTTLAMPDVNLIQILARREMEQLNYAQTAVPLTAKLQLPLVLGHSSVEILRLLYRRWQFGGVRNILNLSDNYLARVRQLSRRGSGQHV